MPRDALVREHLRLLCQAEANASHVISYGREHSHTPAVNLYVRGRPLQAQRAHSQLVQPRLISESECLGAGFGGRIRRTMRHMIKQSKEGLVEGTPCASLGAMLSPQCKGLVMENTNLRVTKPQFRLNGTDDFDRCVVRIWSC